MQDHINITDWVNHAFASDASESDLSSLENQNLVEILELLRSACLAARNVLCETVLRDDFEHDGAFDAISSLNNALVRSSFLD